MVWVRLHIMTTLRQPMNVTKWLVAVIGLVVLGLALAGYDVAGANSNDDPVQRMQQGRPAAIPDRGRPSEAPRSATPPPRPPWVRDDNRSVDVSKLPEYLPIVGPDGELLRNADGSVKMVRTRSQPADRTSAPAKKVSAPETVP